MDKGTNGFLAAAADERLPSPKALPRGVQRESHIGKFCLRLRKQKLLQIRFHSVQGRFAVGRNGQKLPRARGTRRCAQGRLFEHHMRIGAADAE